METNKREENRSKLKLATKVMSRTVCENPYGAQWFTLGVPPDGDSFILTTDIGTVRLGWLDVLLARLRWYLNINVILIFTRDIYKTKGYHLMVKQFYHWHDRDMYSVTTRYDYSLNWRFD
jgi:hypothetical protein